MKKQSSGHTTRKVTSDGWSNDKQNHGQENNGEGRDFAFATRFGVQDGIAIRHVILQP